MQNKAELVDEQFSNFNCAQTVFSLFASEVGIDEKIALKVASGFGGGMACAGICGAVTGSYMVVGMKHGHTSNYPEGKAHTKAQIIKFNSLFREKHGALTCKVLTGFDISTPEGELAARRAGVFLNKCPKFIQTACNILEKHF